MTRRCSHCSNNGHNSRTCPLAGGSGGGGGGASFSGGPGSGHGTGGAATGSGGGGGGVKLFGVRLTEGPIVKKSASMGNLLHYHSSSSTAAFSNPSSPSAEPIRNSIPHPDGYLSDDPSHTASSSNQRVDRKKGNHKGVPWTEEEHRMFLIGLKKLGKGDWRGISRNYVVSRTPTQVASHAQKYFLRQSNSSSRKRRSSLFDMDCEQGVVEEVEKRQVSDNVMEEEEEEEGGCHLKREEDVEMRYPTMVPAFISIPLALWLPGHEEEEEDTRAPPSHEIVKPIPLLPKQPLNVDQLVGLSHLTLIEEQKNINNAPKVDPFPLSLLPSSSRPSAFHLNTASTPHSSRSSAP